VVSGWILDARCSQNDNWYGAGSFGGTCYEGAYGKTPNFEEHLIFDKIDDL